MSLIQTTKFILAQLLWKLLKIHWLETRDFGKLADGKSPPRLFNRGWSNVESECPLLCRTRRFPSSLVSPSLWTEFPRPSKSVFCVIGFLAIATPDLPGAMIFGIGCAPFTLERERQYIRLSIFFFLAKIWFKFKQRQRNYFSKVQILSDISKNLCPLIDCLNCLLSFIWCFLLGP